MTVKKQLDLCISWRWRSSGAPSRERSAGSFLRDRRRLLTLPNSPTGTTKRASLCPSLPPVVPGCPRANHSEEKGVRRRSSHTDGHSKILRGRLSPPTQGLGIFKCLVFGVYFGCNNAGESSERHVSGMAFLQTTRRFASPIEQIKCAEFGVIDSHVSIFNGFADF